MSDKLAWVQIDSANLSKKLAPKFLAFKKAKAAWQEIESNSPVKAEMLRLQKEFENEFINEAKVQGVIEKNDSLLFSYKYNREAVAKTTPKAKASTKPMLKL